MLQLSHVDLRCVVESCLASIGPELSRRRHRLTVELPQDALWVHADAARLTQLFANLLSSAASYSPDGGEIKLFMERLDAFASVRIRCEGVRGIGLAEVRSAVELQGGSLEVTGAGPGQDSEFTVLLPALWARADSQGPAVSER